MNLQMSTLYSITAGYNSAFKREEVEDALREEVLKICENPAQIRFEVERLEGALPPEEYDDGYRLPWSDMTITFREAIPSDDLPFAVHQSASGGGNERDVKESMRRAMCRLVLAAMHHRAMEINITVA